MATPDGMRQLQRRRAHQRRARNRRADAAGVRRHRRQRVAVRCCRPVMRRTSSTAVPVTCIDNGMPVVVIEAAQLGATGYESPDRAQCRRGAQGKARNDPARGRPADEPGRRRPPRRAQDDADRRAARGRDGGDAHVHSARLPRGDRRAGRGLRRHRLRRRRHGGVPAVASAARRAQARVGRAPDRRIHGRARNEVRAERHRDHALGVAAHGPGIVRGQCPRSRTAIAADRPPHNDFLAIDHHPPRQPNRRHPSSSSARMPPISSGAPAAPSRSMRPAAHASRSSASRTASAASPPSCGRRRA